MPRYVVEIGRTCSQSEADFCRVRVLHSEECISYNANDFSCMCKDGFRREGHNYATKCIRRDICKENFVECDANASCTYQLGKDYPWCKCNEPNWIEGGGSYPGEVCVAVKKCEVDNGGCDKHAKCEPRPGQQPLCPCLDGYKGGGFQGDVCEDVDECTESKTPPCGTSEQHAVCTNTLGSYHCSCEKGYEGTGNYGDCQRIFIDFCADKKLNDCDPHFATCTINEESYKCKCKPGLEGDGTKDFCKVASGFTSNVYCEILGIPCNEYQDCKRVVSASGSYECFDKSGADQIAVFFGSGPSSNTPGWVLAVVIIGSILLFVGGGFLAFWAYKKAKKQEDDEEMVAAQLNAQQYDYGATGPPPPPLPPSP